MPRRRLRITGRVQGVGYRAWFAREAKALELLGWVRNRGDGSVEAVVEGSDEAVAEIEARATRGPPGARVEDLARTSDDGEDRWSGFAIRESG